MFKERQKENEIRLDRQKGRNDSTSKYMSSTFNKNEGIKAELPACLKSRLTDTT